MAWSAVYQISDGTLVGTGQDVANPLPPGLAVKALAAAPDFGTQQWNPVTLTLDPIPPWTVKDRIDDFMAQPEVTALNASAQTKIRTAAIRILGNLEGRFYVG